MYGYYTRVHDDVYTPQYYTSYKVYELVNNLYDVESGALIWSARSETLDPTDVGKEIKNLVRILIDDLRRRKLL